MRFNKNSFTLIELIIVIVIIGILASIAAPMMQGMKQKAICAEGVTGMGSIRTALRAYRTEYNGDPPVFVPGISGYVARMTEEDFEKWFPTLKRQDLTGVYFGKECYGLYISYPSENLKIICATESLAGVGYPSDAPRAEETKNIKDAGTGGNGYLNMDVRTGKIGQYGLSKSGYGPPA